MSSHIIAVTSLLVVALLPPFANATPPAPGLEHPATSVAGTGASSVMIYAAIDATYVSAQ